jgi:hypothetical protein
MDLISKGFSICLIFLLLSVTTDPAKRNKPMTGTKILLEKTEILSLPLNEKKFNLTYEMDDMGILKDRIPHPMIFSHDNGLLLIDPGPSASPRYRLQRITLDNKKHYERDLGSDFGFVDAQSPFFHDIVVFSNSKTALVYSLGYDNEKDTFSKSKIALLSEDGIPQTTIPLPDLMNGKNLFVLQDGRYWLFEKDNEFMGWQLHDKDHVVHKMSAADKNAVTLPDGSLLVLNNDREAIIFAANGDQEKVKINGSVGRVDGLISGTGLYFGILSFLSESMMQDENGNALQPMAIQIAFFDVKKRQLCLLPEAIISANVFDQNDIPKHFEFFDLDLMSLDEKGNLYSIARTGPKNPEFKIYKYSISKEAQKVISDYVQ